MTCLTATVSLPLCITTDIMPSCTSGYIGNPETSEANCLETAKRQ